MKSKNTLSEPQPDSASYFGGEGWVLAYVMTASLWLENRDSNQGCLLDSAVSNDAAFVVVIFWKTNQMMYVMWKHLSNVII